ncbi:uncharacterized protein LOC110112786 [Dendrobium catenatum]|uniref:Putative WRKY transcription factor 19 n=1 Tax=Dendrobium catenatum TaxID=906689 RepID=A0A2I0WEA5_9ASPA|nr:uncharacterized protein LOC110112786 [Dendrobium catenatum]XP_020700772.1 uncharacterized protein LOC110112786 [Dendrobium catenatum]XP_028552967.1 uncharacterized protein LOC110112786 [Dendrobium catenatum]XP_028552968.1 uncharacterized protein LOC110112786 [Dendrobium catenatum]PKU74004.1 putative WRKY transcription factor 19 [Dendrobium catenatum]
MSNISKHLGLAGNAASLNSPEKWINFQSEVGSQTLTKVRLFSFGPSNEGTKRKRKDIDGDTVSGRAPLVPVLPYSPNPPESSNKNSSTLSLAFSPYVADEEFSVNQDLNLQLKHISRNMVSKPSVNLELSLSFGPAISAITSEVETPVPGFYMAHGGGQRCQNGAEGKTTHFQLHGGGRHGERGRHCREVGCTKVSRGKSGFCIKHGGGRRCKKEECTNGAAGGSGFCIAHGGGRRCCTPECTKGAQGSTKFCKAHGGGKRCSISSCGKGAEGSTPFCKRHGGGKRCLFQGGGNKCSKSVRGGTQFCVAHGGGKRCANPGCRKSARGRTDYCVRHGGGKRCQLDGCGKSAQGSTDFCKAHGGGRRCSWVVSDGTSCNRLSSGKVGLCAAHSALVQDLRVHGGETMGSPASQKPAGDDSCLFIIPAKPEGVSLTEGTVHGGSLMEFLAKGVPLNQHENRAEEGSTYERESSHTTMDAFKQLSLCPGFIYKSGF